MSEKGSGLRIVHVGGDGARSHGATWFTFDDPGGPAEEVFARARRPDLRSRAVRAIDRVTGVGVPPAIKVEV